MEKTALTLRLKVFLCCTDQNASKCFFFRIPRVAYSKDKLNITWIIIFLSQCSQFPIEPFAVTQVTYFMKIPRQVLRLKPKEGWRQLKWNIPLFFCMSSWQPRLLLFQSAPHTQPGTHDFFSSAGNWQGEAARSGEHGWERDRHNARLQSPQPCEVEGGVRNADRDLSGHGTGERWRFVRRHHAVGEVQRTTVRPDGERLESSAVLSPFADDRSSRFEAREPPGKRNRMKKGNQTNKWINQINDRCTIFYVKPMFRSEEQSNLGALFF